jgi:hypothetical protein
VEFFDQLEKLIVFELESLFCMELQIRVGPYSGAVRQN